MEGDAPIVLVAERPPGSRQGSLFYKMKKELNREDKNTDRRADLKTCERFDFASDLLRDKKNATT